jgi:hypothetical protein
MQLYWKLCFLMELGSTGCGKVSTQSFADKVPYRSWSFGTRVAL